MLLLLYALSVLTCSGSNYCTFLAILQAEVIKHCPLLVFGRRRSDRLTNGACAAQQFRCRHSAKHFIRLGDCGLVGRGFSDERLLCCLAI